MERRQLLVFTSCGTQLPLSAYDASGSGSPHVSRFVIPHPTAYFRYEAHNVRCTIVATGM